MELFPPSLKADSEGSPLNPPRFTMELFPPPLKALHSMFGIGNGHGNGLLESEMK